MELGHDEFTASNGRLHCLQQKHMIKCSVLSGEAADVSDSVVKDQENRLPDICRNYAPEGIFNSDETGLFFLSLPCRSLVWKSDPCKGEKQAKDS